MKRRKSYRWAVVGSVLLLVVGGLFLAPRYLLYADPPVKSDVVILFVGPGFEDRLIEARRLVREGYARNLFIPAVREAGRKLPSFYENTHVEALEAKRLMDSRGFRSALFVSSPYHMRRIRLISGEVFDPERYTVRFVPARCGEEVRGLKRFNSSDLRWQVSEYLKIGWFLAYSAVD